MSSPVSSSPNAPAQQVSDNKVADRQESIKKDVDKVTGGEPVIKSVGEPKEVGFWEWVDHKVSSIDWSEVGHTILDVVGMIPVVGEIADGINALWYLAEGDYLNAALAAAALVPFAGAAATGAKLIGKGLQKYGDEAVSAMGCLRTVNSFAADTRELMEDGSTKPIQEVKVGDKVLATDPTTDGTGAREVTDLIVGTGAKDLVKITVDTDGAVGVKTDSLTATGGPPFWVEGRAAWRDAKELEPGDDLRAVDGSRVEVVSTTEWTEYRKVYNLTVDGLHTFYVVFGNIQSLVHNSGWCPNGGFKVGVEVREICDINRRHASGHLSKDKITSKTVVLNVNYYSNYCEKVASAARDIADGYPFLEGNKRTAYDVVSLLMERNGRTPVPEGLWNVIGAIGRAMTMCRGLPTCFGPMLRS